MYTMGMSELLDIEAEPVYDFSAIVAANIRAQLALNSVNQKELAKAIGINQGAVSARWRGKRQWQLEDLAKVAAVLGTTPWELVQPMEDKEKLPQLDSNQQPFDYGYLLVGVAVVSAIGVCVFRRLMKHERY